MNDLRGDLLTLGEWQGSLKDVVENLEFLEKQLLYSAHAAEEELKAQFSQLEQELISALKQRRNTLLSEVSAARAKAMKPLSDCKKQIEVEIAAADLAHAEGTQLARSDGDSGTASPEEMRMFCRRISDFESLPDIPTLLDVGTVAVTFDRGSVAQWTTGILQHGVVTTTCSVVITHAESRPGALRVHWIEPEEDNCGLEEEHEYRLQHCVGDVLGHEPCQCQFADVYTGSENSFLVRGLTQSQPQCFRVARRIRGSNPWGAWSPLFVGSTEIPHYEWQEGDPCYARTHEGRIATRTPCGPATVLFSKDPLRRMTQSLLFRFLDVPPGKHSKRDGVALVVGAPRCLLAPSSVFVNMEGEIFVSGRRTTTQLPPLGRGSDATFDVEIVSDHKVRVTVSCKEKQATYDLKLKGHDLHSVADGALTSDLRFAALFEEEGWKVLVE